MKTLLIKSENIKKDMGHGKDVNHILSDISVELYKGDFTVIMGASGAGKSTLLYAISGMDQITSGKIFYKGKEMKYHENQMATLRSQEFGFVFQQAHLISNLTLLENVLVAGYLKKNQSEKEVKAKAASLMNLMHIAGAQKRLPASVSGGEAQRAAIARAMIHEPSIIFADEPTGALNKKTSQEVMDILTGLNKGGQSILMVTHDIHVALRANRLLYLEDGKIIGEKNMPDYTEETIKMREESITAWLTSLQW